MSSQEGGEDDDDFIDDLASAWEQCKLDGSKWGGKGKGGRGLSHRYACMSTANRDVLVEDVSLAYAGKDLLQDAKLRLIHGRRYALIGRNGVGKSTLLRRITQGKIPGFPLHLRISMVAQEDKRRLPESSTVANWLVESVGAARKKGMERQKEFLEERLDAVSAEDPEAIKLAERLGEIDTELDQLDDGQAMEKVTQVLAGLGFTEKMRGQAASVLSGGWRMRLAIAEALLTEPDILVLDEPTNHLDLHGVLWLEKYLSSPGACGTAVIVSHDRDFLANVATDVIIFENQSLRTFPGNLEEFERHEAENAARHISLLDARVRQEKKTREAADDMKKQAMRSKGGTNDGQLRQAKQKLDKIARIGLYRDDGKAFKLNSLKTLDADAVRLPSRVEAERGEKDEAMAFPDPNITELRCASMDDALMSLDDVCVGYGSTSVLRAVTLHVTQTSRVAVVGSNGCGKTTLLRLLAGQIEPLNGSVWRKSCVRVAAVPQHHLDVLSDHLSVSAAHYLSERFAVTVHEARARLAKFGLSGDVAVAEMRTLSGGQRVRVSLTAVTWSAPHVLLLDEPTNHLDTQGVHALAQAVRDFAGAVVIVSHDRAFCVACCNDLWVVDQGIVRAMRGDADEAPFAQLFKGYAASVLSRDMGDARKGTTDRKAAAAIDAMAAARGGTRRGKDTRSATQRSGLV